MYELNGSTPAQVRYLEDDFPHQIVNRVYENNHTGKSPSQQNPIYLNEPGVGRFSFSTNPAAVRFLGSGKYIYPNLPTGCLMGEFITFKQTLDCKYHGDSCFGNININTAAKEVLAALPFGTEISIPDKGGDKTYSIDAQNAADAILEYRNNDDRNGYRPSAVDAAKCFLTQGEIALPLGKYVTSDILQSDLIDNLDSDPKRDWRHHYATTILYNRIGSCISVRSDTYGVYINVSEGKPEDGGKSHIYYAVVNRLASSAGNNPTILLFTEIK